LEKTKDGYKKLGYNVCAISYDKVSILDHFSKRKNIKIPLLSDTSSTVIKNFGLLRLPGKPNEKSNGLPYPGTFFINKEMVITKKSMEKNYWERKTMQSILLSEFGKSTTSGKKLIESPQLNFTYYASQDTLYPGVRVSICFEVNLTDHMHVYSPGIKGDYKPISLKIDSNEVFDIKDIKYPEPKTIFLKAIGEKVSVYSGNIKIFQDITIGKENKLKKVNKNLKEVVITGNFSYQACDDKICYPPTSIPFRLSIPLAANDWVRIR